MLINLFQLFFAIAFVVLVCVFMNKVILPLALKVFNLSFKSPVFRIIICCFLALFFVVGGIIQLNDFMKESNPGLARFFPLSFLVSGIFVFLGSQKHNFTK